MTASHPDPRRWKALALLCSADLLGRRRMFMVGTGLFAVASVGCGLAWSDAALIGARVIQGVAAAIMTPTAAWLVGGPITSGLGWEWIFFINVPVGLTLLALSPVLLKEGRAGSGARSFDVA